MLKKILSLGLFIFLCVNFVQADVKKVAIVDIQKVVMEVEAQYLRLVELTGKKPYMIEAHAVPSDNFNKALGIVAAKYGVESMKFEPGRGPKVGNTIFKFSMDSGNPDYNPFESMKKAMNQDFAEDEAMLMVLHPGYVDEYVLNTSYITVQRALEVAMAINPEFELISIDLE